MEKILSVSFWNIIGVFILQFVVVCLLIPQEFVEGEISKELRDISQKLGSETATEIRDDTNYYFNAIFINTGFYSHVHKMLIPSESQRERSRGMEDIGKDIFPFVESRLKSLWVSITQAIMRFFHFVAWLPFLLILIVPAILDGIYQRKIRITTFRHVSAVRHRFGLRGIWLTVLVMFIISLLPISLPTLLFPFIGAALAIMINASITFTQKRL